MNISELIETLEYFLDAEGETEIFIYDSHGDKIEPEGIQKGSISRGRGIEDYAYIYELE